MLRLILTLMFAMTASSAFSQAPSPNEPAATDSTSSAQQQPSNNSDQPSKKKPNKVTRKLNQALPDCVNLIFYHGCRSGSANQDEAEKLQQKKYDEAAERCRQLTAVLPASLAPKRAPAPATENAENNGTFSSSAQSQESMPYCTAEDVVAADHDIDVGDFNLENKNYRGAEMRYRSALERLPGEPTASLHLARVLEKNGKKAEAVDHYKTYLAWSPTGKEADEARSALDRLQKELAQE